MSGLLAHLRIPAWLRSHLSGDESIIRDSGLLDPDWYRDTYPDVAARGADPLRHYVRNGAREGRDPNRLFSSSWYLASYPDVAEAGFNPLVHYILRGAREGRNPGPLFDTRWYLDAYPDVVAAGMNPLLHYLRHGAREGRRPNGRIGSVAWHSPLARIDSPHSRNAQRKSFDHEAARDFVAAVRSGPGRARLLAERPLISVMMPARDRAELLAAAIESVMAQTYDHWELLIVDDGSRDATPTLARGFLVDQRVRLLSSGGRGVATARNVGMAQASGRFFAYLDSDNRWLPDFLEIAASCLLQERLDLVYSALETNDGWRRRYVGSDYDFTALSRRNYIDINVVLHRRELYDERGGCDEALKRMSDWDLVLRYARDSRVAYAPFIGCAYDDRMTRRDRITVSESVGWIYVVLGKHHVDWIRLQGEVESRDGHLVSVIVPIHGQAELTAECLASLFETDAGCPFELILVDNGSDPSTAALLDRCAAARAATRLVRNWENLNFALGCNIGFAASRGGIVVFLNNDTRVSAGWLGALVSPLSHPDIGAVQPKLLFPDGTVQSFGTVVGERSGIPYELYRGLPGGAPHLGRPRTLDLVSGACLAIRAADFAALRGFDPIFMNGQEDSDLCMRLKTTLGKTCLVEPSSIVIHREGGTPGRGRFTYGNRQLFVERWRDRLIVNDAEIYRSDGYRAREYAPDVPEWIPVGLASYRPILEAASTCARPVGFARAASTARPSFAIKIACPSEAVREEWGDYHFARGLADALQRLGCHCRIDYLRTWPDNGGTHDVDLVLRGLERFVPTPGRPSLLWIISHPDLVTREELSRYAHIFVASRLLAHRLSGTVEAPVEPLLQCTDSNVFFPPPTDAARNRDILFVGNSRNVFRPAVRAAIEAGLSPIVYGTRWDGLLDRRLVRGAIVPNSTVAELYRTAGVVLNDHWPDMREAGILSNRVFDALACAAPVISDHIPDLPAGFADFVSSFGAHRPIRDAIVEAMNEDADRRARRRAFADVVRRDHGFDSRAAIILDRAQALLARSDRSCNRPK